MSESYTQEFPTLTQATQTSQSSDKAGVPLDVAFGGSNTNDTATIYDDSEFANGIGLTGSGATSVTSITDPTDFNNQPFTTCLFGCPPKGPGLRSDVSDGGERVISADGLVWFTQAGGSYEASGAPNYSEIVAYNPANNGICNFQLPGGTAQATGIAATGTTIWVAEQGPDPAAGALPTGALDSFQPFADPNFPADCTQSATTSVIQNGQTTYTVSGGTFDQLATPPIGTVDFQFHRYLWPSGTTKNSDGTPASYYTPIMITPDPSSPNHLWVTDFNGDSVADVTVNPTAGTVAADPTTNKITSIYDHPLPGSLPWQVAVDDNYVYVADYGSQTLVRMSKTADAAGTFPIDFVQIPVTSDLEQGYGLALDQNNQKLYFTLANDQNLQTPPPPFDSGSTFGYVDLASWQPDVVLTNGQVVPQQPSGVVFTGLSENTNPSSGGDFRGIAVLSTSNGTQIALADSVRGPTADSNQVIRLCSTSPPSTC